MEFFVVNKNFARIFARISLVFLLKMRPYFARIFTKMSPYEELVTLFKVRFSGIPNNGTLELVELSQDEIGKEEKVNKIQGSVVW